MMKKEYHSPEFEEIKVLISNNLLASAEEVIHDGEREASDW